MGGRWVYFSERRGYFVGERFRYDYYVGLARVGAEDYVEAVYVIAGRRYVYYFYGVVG